MIDYRMDEAYCMLPHEPHCTGGRNWLQSEQSNEETEANLTKLLYQTGGPSAANGLPGSSGFRTLCI